MNFENYQVDDFLMDESFCNSVRKPDSDDAKFWNSWLNDHPEKKYNADEAKKVIRSISFKDLSFKKAEITKLWENITSETTLKKSNQQFSKLYSNPVSKWNYLNVAAVILPFLVAGFLLFYFLPDSSPEKVVLPQLIQKQNPKGQKLTIFLSDGSKVKLNSDSKISFLSPFDKNQRMVQLEGEAFFEVAPDKKKPFIVKSGNIETRVLGTSFNITAYPAENDIKVAVKNGKVAVENKNLNLENPHNNSILLLPTEMATYSATTKKTTISSYDPKEVLGWSDGMLYFNNASIGEFIAKLERWYGIEIEVQRSKPIAKGIVGEFHNQTLEEILMGTKDASEFDYEFKDDKVIIR